MFSQKTLNAHSPKDMQDNAEIKAQKAIASRDDDIVSKTSKISMTDKIALGVHPSPSTYPDPGVLPKGMTRLEKPYARSRRLRRIFSPWIYHRLCSASSPILSPVMIS